MSMHKDIDQAILAHSNWKQTLRIAIDTGKCESTPAKVKMDNNCSFGKWLYERIDPSVKGTKHYNEVVDLHAQFHKEAGSILELALDGKKDEANERMKLGSLFSSLSSKLTLKMRAWQETL